jgi:hypothetical protein
MYHHLALVKSNCLGRLFSEVNITFDISTFSAPDGHAMNMAP